MTTQEGNPPNDLNDHLPNDLKSVLQPLFYDLTMAQT